MVAGLANILPSPSVAIVPRLEPYLVEVVVPFPLGSADEAVQMARDAVARLLDGPSLGAASAAPPETDDDSPRVATTSFTQALLRERIATTVTDLARGIAAAEVRRIFQTPGVLRGLLPRDLPDTPATAWDDGGVFAFTPD